MTEPLVSIIIPCWNAEAFVGEAIDSALAQTYRNAEVIVIDDGSTDGSLEVIKSYGDRIRWETGPNRGAPAARNRGLALAAGAYVLFLDADDLLLPPAIQALFAALIEGRGDASYGNVQLVDADTKYIGERRYPACAGDTI
ncbi:MAG: glycosyltransferase [Rhodospirillales bacterium]|nr:glycosyltransferase [Rhodospirillales bacterium]